MPQALHAGVQAQAGSGHKDLQHDELRLKPLHALCVSVPATIESFRSGIVQAVQLKAA